MALVPPDLLRCQAEYLGGSFMTLGPRQMVRCYNRPTVVVTERRPGKDRQVGSMSLWGEAMARLPMPATVAEVARARGIPPEHATDAQTDKWCAATCAECRTAWGWLLAMEVCWKMRRVAPAEPGPALWEWCDDEENGSSWRLHAAA